MKEPHFFFTPKHDLLRISSVFFLVMKLLYLISEPLWQEALTSANAIAEDTVVVPGVTGMIKAIKQK